MCENRIQIHCVIENRNGTFRVERYNFSTRQYEIIHNQLSEVVAQNIKKELDADLQDA